ncbi:hypothetical protein Nepgr_014684 [Nepenthes gracilis]|uniref:Uncharacterized protein n=1 Tax=Nepenthes gracilis TaxID=150966 RepID=A0AAD3SJY8_NEPGR|nr:hypothetical protein Nepgr_014684 [Nepenthes gracilis]
MYKIFLVLVWVFICLQNDVETWSYYCFVLCNILPQMTPDVDGFCLKGFSCSTARRLAVYLASDGLADEMSCVIEWLLVLAVLFLDKLEFCCTWNGCPADGGLGLLLERLLDLFEVLFRTVIWSTVGGSPELLSHICSSGLVLGLAMWLKRSNSRLSFFVEMLVLSYELHPNFWMILYCWNCAESAGGGSDLMPIRLILPMAE